MSEEYVGRKHIDGILEEAGMKEQALIVSGNKHLADSRSMILLAREIRFLRAELSRRPVPEAAPGGVTEYERGAVEVLTKYQGQCDEDGTNVQVSREALDVTLALVRRLLTPAPNRDAELKVIEAAKAWRAQKLKPEFNDKEDERIVGILHDALASLAQAEMKGEQ